MVFKDYEETLEIAVKSIFDKCRRLYVNCIRFELTGAQHSSGCKPGGCHCFPVKDKELFL